ncbi:GGDEF domain-containing protein [Chitinolyticbacter albus]|uniref:GGDEF domain-containing protein n=1 Tax=Chitinolyticbacter albus TaxID=2961951 RepID=UPI002546414F|nr:GGDEF domain-containing protein [Chitinolyticbacter albus]
METLQQENKRLRRRLIQMAGLLRTARHNANHDVLTGLANRLLLLDRLQHALALALRLELQVGVLVLDLDGFKLVNDELGHDAGDRVLKIVAERLNGCVRASDTVARIGGDEFAVVLPGIGNAALPMIVDKINRALATPYLLDEREVHISACIGKMVQGVIPRLPQEILAQADQDMYRVKMQRRRGHSLPAGWADIAAVGLYSPVSLESH